MSFSSRLSVASSLRMLGGIVLGVGLGLVLHDTLKLNGFVVTLIAAIVFLSTVLTKVLLQRTALWDLERQYLPAHDAGYVRVGCR
jgi:hypothetical protein